MRISGQNSFHLLISSSRHPTRTIRTLMRDLHRVIPYSHRVNRGKMGLKDLAETASRFGVKYVMLVARWKGNPGKLEFYRLNRENEKLELLPPVIYIKGVRFQREYRTAWGKLRIRPKRLFTIKGCSEDAVKIAEALSKFFNSKGWVESLGGGERGAVYLEVEGVKPHRIVFHSVVGGETVEVGPSLMVRHVVWRGERPEEG